MQRISSLILGLCAFTFTASTHAITKAIEEWSFKPFIGFDAGIWHQDFEALAGEENFRHNYPHTNFYVGSIFYKYLGFEFGYEYNYRQNKEQYYYPGQATLGYIPAAGDVARLQFSDSYFEGWHLDLMAFVPLCKKTKTDLLLTLGLGWLQGHYQTSFIADAATTPGATIVAPLSWSSDSEAVLRLGIGIEQMLTEHFGTRVQFFWENTDKLGSTVIVSDQQTLFGVPGIYVTNPHNSYSATIGFFFQVT